MNQELLLNLIKIIPEDFDAQRVTFRVSRIAGPELELVIYDNDDGTEEHWEVLFTRK